MKNHGLEHTITKCVLRVQQEIPQIKKLSTHFHVLRDWMPVCVELTLDLHFKRGCFISRCTYLE